MAFLLGPALAELGTFLTEVGVEAGVSRGIAGGVAGTAVSTVGDAINEKVDELFTSVVGEENAKSLIDLKNQTTDVLSAVLTGNTENFVLDKQETAITGQEYALLLTEHASELAEHGAGEHIKEIIGFDVGTDQAKSDAEITKDLVAEDPKKLTMAQRMSEFYADKSLSKSPEFKAIYDTYDGTGIRPENVIMAEDNEKWMFSLFDEVGELVYLEQYKKAFTLPAVYKIFGGAMSPNNSISKDVPDTCFLCHDAEYATSYFSWKSDMKLVSRLVQTRDQWPEDSVKLLNSIVIYFATIGASLAIIKGSIVGEATGTDKEEAKDDLFAAVAPGALQLEPEEYFIQKKEFYESFETGLKEGFENHSPLGKNTPFQSRSRIGNIKFEIL